MCRGSRLGWDGGLAVHHFNVPAPLDVLDRFIALHYTDWESLNGRNINNPPAQPRLGSRYSSPMLKISLINTEYFPHNNLWRGGPTLPICPLFSWKLEAGFFSTSTEKIFLVIFGVSNRQTKHQDRNIYGRIQFLVMFEVVETVIVIDPLMSDQRVEVSVYSWDDLYSFQLKSEISTEENIKFMTASPDGWEKLYCVCNKFDWEEVGDGPAPSPLLRLSWLNSSILKPIIIFGAINIKQNKWPARL